MKDEKHKFPLTGNILKLSDLFRRAVAFDNHDAAKNLVQLGYELGCNLTYIYPEYGMNEGINREARAAIKETLTKMQDVALKAGLMELQLPLSIRNPDAQAVKMALTEINPRIAFTFSTKSYGEDLSDAGWIRPEIKTCMSEGVSGFIDATREIKNKWYRDIQKGQQLGFDF